MSEEVNFITTLQTNINNPIINVNLTPVEISYINILLNEESHMTGNPTVINQIEFEFNNIVKEGKISIIYIPELVLLMTNILKTHIISNTLQNIGIINIIQFLLNSLLTSNLLPLNDEEVCLIKSLINTSLELLKTNIDFLYEENVYCDFIKKFNICYF